MKTITINPDEKFYAAIGEYRTFHASPKYIIKSMPFDTYKEAVDYINDRTISEDGRAIYISRDNKWISISKHGDEYRVSHIYNKETNETNKY